MRIAVISDTHDRFPASLPEGLRGADEIWHLGDVCAPETLVEFELLGPPLRVVLGNASAVLVQVNGQPREIPAGAIEGEGARFVVNRSGSLSRSRQ